MGDSTIGYPEPPGYSADVPFNPQTVGEPRPLREFAQPGGVEPPAITGGRMDAREPKRELRMSKRFTMTQGTQFGDDLGFNARSVIVDNNTGQWLYDAASRRYVPPACFGAVLQFPSGSQIGTVSWTPPPGVTQPAGLAGSQAVLIYTEDLLDPSAGIISAAGMGQPGGAASTVVGGNTISGGPGLATGPTVPTAANILDGFASVTATTTTTLVTVPAGRTWLGYVGVSAATSTAAAATTTATAASTITTANGTGTPTPPAGTYVRTDAVAAANAAGGTAGNAAATAVDGQRLLVQASAGGTALIQHVATIANGTSPVCSGWALGELL